MCQMTEISKMKITNCLQRAAAESRLLTYLAVKIRNQCNIIVAKRMATGVHIHDSGEGLLLDALRGQIRTFIDVGAHRGDWVKYLYESHGEGPRGLLIEPSKFMLKDLEKNILPFAKFVNIINAAVSSKTGETYFWAQKIGPRHQSSMYKDLVPGDVACLTVPLTTISEQLEIWGETHLDFLKIDAEGADFDVILGASSLIEKHRIRFVQFEYSKTWHLAGHRLSSALKFFDNFQYNVFLIRGLGLYRFDLNFFGEFCSFANFLSVSKDATPLVSSIIRGKV